MSDIQIRRVSAETKDESRVHQQELYQKTSTLLEANLDESKPFFSETGPLLNEHGHLNEEYTCRQVQVTTEGREYAVQAEYLFELEKKMRYGDEPISMEEEIELRSKILGTSRDIANLRRKNEGKAELPQLEIKGISLQANGNPISSPKSVKEVVEKYNGQGRYIWTQERDREDTSRNHTYHTFIKINKAIYNITKRQLGILLGVEERYEELVIGSLFSSMVTDEREQRVRNNECLKIAITIDTLGGFSKPSPAPRRS